MDSVLGGEVEVREQLLAIALQRGDGLRIFGPVLRGEADDRLGVRARGRVHDLMQDGAWPWAHSPLVIDLRTEQ